MTLIADVLRAWSPLDSHVYFMYICSPDDMIYRTIGLLLAPSVMCLQLVLVIAYATSKCQSISSKFAKCHYIWFS
jgi:hypothetical protein